MEKLRDMFGGWIIVFLIIVFEIILVYIFPDHPTINTVIGIALALAIFYVINKLADRKELERIKDKQNTFVKEFDDFKTRYAFELVSMPYLYPLIEMAQAQTIKNCENYPNRYRNVKSFRTVTAQIIISKLDEYLSTYRHRLDLHENEINSFISEIKRRERLS